MSEQIQHDFAPVWHVKASVAAYPAGPPGTWTVHIQKQLAQPGALGYHTDDHHQPLAYVELTASWTVTVSHEVLEMLADPWGSRLHSAELSAGVQGDYARFGLASAKGRVSYLLEVCDPCEATSYAVGGEQLSDFLLPSWYRTSPSPALTYSQAGGCDKPREVAEGGYVSFGGPTGEWFQVFNQVAIGDRRGGKDGRRAGGASQPVGVQHCPVGCADDVQATVAGVWREPRSSRWRRQGHRTPGRAARAATGTLRRRGRSRAQNRRPSANRRLSAA